METLHINKRINKKKKKENNSKYKIRDQKNIEFLKSYIKNKNKTIYKNEKNNINDGNIKSIYNEKDKIQLIRNCKNNDNIFDFIDIKYKKYFLENKDNNDSNICQFVFFESINAYELKKYNLSKKVFNIILEITKNNMKKMYNESNFLNKGWSDIRKMKELKNDKSKLILGFLKVNIKMKNEEKYNFLDIIKSNDQKKIDNYLQNYKLICFVHFRLTPDYYPYQKNIICYLYEIQIIPNYTKLGLGVHLISMLENLCKNIKLKKIICTVLKKNIRAISFYKNKCSFEIDENSPDNFITDNSESCEYEILKKVIV
ncbi:acetyltransferase, GNAT family, putative [Plasmodium gallinaceum]|uniref:N-alpha-acetyltransferase 40 n=1 Tax=Plasmodium gallinaceum TaxID=5849 RepID=A0A1J1GV89_PLAGA|nr:acetyltransferase, GNAT family, putative [Plasmodium gallinaceum]CRG94955.1 acetyltransferase, GNAT family, putative [Plasmodium gallinaceum]